MELCDSEFARFGVLAIKFASCFSVKELSYLQYDTQRSRDLKFLFFSTLKHSDCLYNLLRELGITEPR